jgi:hypothetical protein
MCIDAGRESSGILIPPLKIHEKNYPTHDMELETVVHALKS